MDSATVAAWINVAIGFAALIVAIVMGILQLKKKEPTATEAAAGTDEDTISGHGEEKQERSETFHLSSKEVIVSVLFGAGAGPLWVLLTGKNISFFIGVVSGIVATLFLLLSIRFIFKMGCFMLVVPFVIAAIIALFGSKNIMLVTGALGITVFIIPLFIPEGTEWKGAFHLEIAILSTVVALLLGTILGGFEDALIAGALGTVWGIIYAFLLTDAF